MKNESKLYAQRDRRKLGRQFALHMTAMTAESLEQKGDIAAELAHRDAEIERLRKAVEDWHDIAVRAERENAVVKKLLADVVQCMPGYAGCGDISRELRVIGELEAALGKDMPQRMGA